MNYTSSPQSKYLLELGLNPDTADMMYVQNQGVPIIMNDCFAIELDQPCWSVGALLGLMPKILSLKPIIDLEDNTIYYSGTDIIKEGKTLMEAAYNMIVWLLQNKYIKTK